MPDPFLPGLLARLSEPPRNVALVRASRIGDYVCATPAFRAIRRALPQTKITLIAMPFIGQLAAGSRHFDQILPFPGFPGMAEQFFDARRAVAFFQAAQRERFDLAVQMHGSGVYSNPFTLMLGARVTAGFIRPGDPPGRLDAALPVPEQVHEIHRLLALIRFLGIPSCGDQTELSLRPEDQAGAETLIAGLDRPLMGLHPAAREPSKRWPAERFAAVGAELHRRHGGTVVVLGGPEEQGPGEALAREIGRGSVSLAGRTSLPELGAVLARLSLLVTNDSGPAHMAYAVGTPTVCLFQATDPEVWGPLDRQRHRVLRLGPDEITIEQVVSAADDARLTASRRRARG